MNDGPVNEKYSSVYHLVAAANVLKSNIKSYYPRMNTAFDMLADEMNTTFKPSEGIVGTRTLHIMWTSNKATVPRDNRQGNPWVANHFVPLMALPRRRSSGTSEEVT